MDNQRERRVQTRRRADTLQIEARERALLLAHSLVAANYQHRTEKEGIRQFFNCLQMVIQEPLAVLLVRKTEDQAGDFISVYHTALDPLIKDAFERHLKEYLKARLINHNLYIPHQRLENKLFKVHKHYYVALVRLVDLDKDINHPSEFQWIKNNSNDAEIREYLKIFSDHADLLQDYVSQEMIVEFEKKALPQYWEYGKVRQKEQSTNLSYDFLVDLTDTDYACFYQKHFEKISGLFNEAYEKIRDSALLKYNAFQPPNIMFAVRLFDRKSARLANLNRPEGNYPYGVRGVFPDEQKRDILRSLNTLRRVQKERCHLKGFRDSKGQRFFFPKPKHQQFDYAQLEPGDFPPEGNACFGSDSEFFWQLIESESSFDELLTELEASYGEQARALSDSVFCSGVVTVAKEPFLKTRGMRMSHDKWIQGNRDLDYRRLVYYHYLMSMAAPGAGSMSALIVPGRVGGSTWFTMGYYFTDRESRHSRWLKCYHFYHNVALHFTRTIRSSAKKLFLKELNSLFYWLISEVFPAKNPHAPLALYAEMINPYFRLLCRVYPFAQVVLEQLPDDAISARQTEFFAQIQSKLCFFNVHIDDNPYFESTTGASYVTAIDVARTLSERDTVRFPFVRNT